MKALAIRIRRLEARLAPQEDLESWRVANLLYERQRRRALAAGEPFDRSAPEAPVPGARYVSAAEMLRRKRLASRSIWRTAGVRAEPRIVADIWGYHALSEWRDSAEARMVHIGEMATTSELGLLPPDRPIQQANYGHLALSVNVNSARTRGLLLDTGDSENADGCFGAHYIGLSAFCI